MPARWWRQVDLCEFEASFIYRESRTDRAAQRNLVLKKGGRSLQKILKTRNQRR